MENKLEELYEVRALLDRLMILLKELGFHNMRSNIEPYGNIIEKQIQYWEGVKNEG